MNVKKKKAKINIPKSEIRSLMSFSALTILSSPGPIPSNAPPTSLAFEHNASIKAGIVAQN